MNSTTSDGRYVRWIEWLTAPSPSQAVNSGAAVTVDYTPGTNPIKDLWGNEATPGVRNDTAASTDATLSVR